MSSIPSGTMITCSRKGHPIGRTKSPLKSGDPLRLSAIEMVLGQERIQGEQMHCKICGSSYYQDGKIHTDQDWMPGPPRIEPVRPKKDFSEKRDRKLGKEEAKQAECLEKFKKDKKDKKEKKDKQKPNHP
jgi:hypothetical protein